jgi:hypothetical protein
MRHEPAADETTAQTASRIRVFLSHARARTLEQDNLVLLLVSFLESHGFEASSFEITKHDVVSPFTGIQSAISAASGIVCVALRRTFIERGTRNFKPNLQGVTPERLDGQWLTSSWLQVETSIAFQMGLPVLILREAGVIADGVLEPDIIGDRTPEFSLDGEDVGRYLQRLEQTTAFRKWRQLVHNHARRTPQHSSLLDPN